MAQSHWRKIYFYGNLCLSRKCRSNVALYCQFRIRDPRTRITWSFSVFEAYMVEAYLDIADYSLDLGHKINVYKTFRRCPERLLNVLCTFN